MNDLKKELGITSREVALVIGGPLLMLMKYSSG
jgi:hypothetical protein